MGEDGDGDGDGDATPTAEEEDDEDEERLVVIHQGGGEGTASPAELR